MLLEGVQAAQSAVANFDFSSIDFSQVTTTYVTILGIAIPTVVSLMAVKKGIGSLLGMIRRA